MVVGLLAVLSLSGCGPKDSVSAGRIVHDDGEGIRSASMSAGGQGLYRPHGKRRKGLGRGSFGGLLLCLEDPGSGPVRVDRVRYDFAVRPRDRRTWVRTVPEPAAQRPGQALAWAPFYGLVGAPGAFRNGTMRGNFTPFEEGLEISQACEVGLGPFTELITVLDTGPGGAWSRRVFIDHTADGVDYTLVVPWEMVTCGRNTREYCQTAGS